MRYYACPMKPYHTFIFDSSVFDPVEGKIALNYTLDDEISFMETLTLPSSPSPVPNPQSLETTLHALHLIGGISYYKTCLPPQIDIRTQPLTEEQARFWNEVYGNGLGEFFFRNNLDPADRIHFPSQTAGDISPPPPGEGSGERERVLVPLGGGKDSVVTVELLRAAGCDVTLLRVGKHPLIDRLAKEMGLPLLTVDRALSANLFKLNEAGALNGHVPVTAYLSFLSLVLGDLYGFDAVVFSNERSASEGNVVYKDKEINHQWSKSLAFERMLQAYARRYVTADVTYFSLLRPWSELRIVQEFLKHPQYLPLTTSCNKNWRIVRAQSSQHVANNHKQHTSPSPLGEGVRGEGDGTEPGQSLWCGECPKCAFVYALYAAFLPRSTLTALFGDNKQLQTKTSPSPTGGGVRGEGKGLLGGGARGEGKDLFSDSSLLPIYRQLLGVEGFKPFECVGTPDETKAAFYLAHERKEWKGTPVMDFFEREILPSIADPDALVRDVLSSSADHAIPEAFRNLIPNP